MFATLAKRTVLLGPLVLLLAGCVEEDSITITGDGVVSFQSTVTITDEDKKLNFAEIDKGVSDVMTELQQAKWKVERKWVSEKRPYAFQVTGSGNLREVGALTKFYALTPVFTDFYRVLFLTPAAADGSPTRRRIAFSSSSTGAASASVHDASGRFVTQIDNVAAGDVYTIQLRPSPDTAVPGA